ncbi:MAG: peptidoglycan DD-metalloendopeptidase family protein [Nitratireductor sp.]
MRSVVLSNRIRCLSQVAMAGILSALLAGCSSDATRFDRTLYSALPQSKPNQYDQAMAARQQQYPGDVDATTTASIGGNGVPLPLGDVRTNIVPSDDGAQYVGNQAPAYQQPRYQTPTYRAPTYQAPSYNQPAVNNTYSNIQLPKPSVVRQSLPQVSTQPVVDRVRTASIDRVNRAKTSVSNLATKTVSPVFKPLVQKAAPVVNRAASVKPIVQQVASEPKKTLIEAATNVASKSIPESEGGWSKIGGSSVQLRQGETLYNLSKRFGVPVRELMAANSIGSANELRAGQLLTIPTYVYSKSAPISAPDSDPDTYAARSTRGYLGQANASNIQLPTRRPEYQRLDQTTTNSVANNVNNTLASNGSHTQPFPSLPKPTGPVDAMAPDYSIVTGSTSKAGQSGSANGIYLVKSGDSLGKIAQQHGTSVAALQKANGLTNTNIRIGQKLKLSGSSSQSAALKQPMPAIDNTVTNSVTKPVKSAPVASKPTLEANLGAGNEVAPKSSGVKTMRWPVNGRVVNGFGVKKSTGRNDGIDISVPEGTSVKAAENGVVIYAGSELAGFGNLVLIRHDDGFVTAYAYNKSLLVRKGAEVKRGQTIARSGKTGEADTPMLHFEVRKNSKPVNPITYLNS